MNGPFLLSSRTAITMLMRLILPYRPHAARRSSCCWLVTILIVVVRLQTGALTLGRVSTVVSRHESMEFNPVAPEN